MPATKKKTVPNLLNDYHLLSFDMLDSTNEEGKRLAKAGGGHGAFIWAKRQVSGKGRMGRKWISDEGNLFVSVLLQPQKPVKDFSELSFVSANAVIESLKDLVPAKSKLSCKWPNDILLNDRKLGGILLESLQGDFGSWVVVGVGINVDSFPPKTDFPATSLKEVGVELVSAKIILSRFIHHFIENYNEWNKKGFAPARKYWMEHAWGVGERLCARLPDKEIEGISQGIDADGSLTLLLDNGKKQQIMAADIYPADR